MFTLSFDRQRYEMVAMATMQEFSQNKSKEDIKDDVVKGQSKHVMMVKTIILVLRILN
jgi:endo-1,4-beta-D-glucanase Y